MAAMIDVDINPFSDVEKIMAWIDRLAKMDQQDPAVIKATKYCKDCLEKGLYRPIQPPKPTCVYGPRESLLDELIEEHGEEKGRREFDRITRDRTP